LPVAEVAVLVVVVVALVDTALIQHSLLRLARASQLPWAQAAREARVAADKAEQKETILFFQPSHLLVVDMVVVI
jgi:hypothetical protein